MSSNAAALVAPSSPQRSGLPLLGKLLLAWSWPELRQHPWRTATALLAVMLGVALAFAVQLINASALSEFSAAVQSVNGQPDFELRGQRGGFDESLYSRVAMNPQVSLASPVVEIDTQVQTAAGERVPLRVLGLDALVAASISPQLLPRPDGTVDRLSMLDPDVIFLNPAAQRLAVAGPVTPPGAQALQRPTASSPRSTTPGASTSTGVTPAPNKATSSATRDASSVPRVLRAQIGTDFISLDVRGSIAASGSALAVMDIAGAQERFGWVGRLSRIDVRLIPGADRDKVLRELALPAGIRAATPDEAGRRVSNVSRGYRVNLTVLALVALFTGAFLVFSILSLSVAKRQPQLALLGVLGLSARERLALVLTESAWLGLVGSALGIAFGTALAALGLRFLSGDLGGGYFPGVAPSLHFSVPAALLYGGLGVVAAMAGGWLPARTAQRLAPAQALKGLGDASVASGSQWFGPVLLVAGAALSFAPPVLEIPLFAYVSVACLLLGGIACVPAGVALMLSFVKPPRSALPLLALQRARHQRNAATIAVAGVVASLSLAVALTVMVASFREAVTEWLDTLLPADLYARTSTSTSGSDTAYLPPKFVDGVRALPGVTRLETLRVVPMQLDPERPSVALIARPLADPARSLPLVGELAPAVAGVTSAFISEAVETLYGKHPGQRMTLPLPDGRTFDVRVRGVWRDYARQYGAVIVDDVSFRELTGDERVNDLALWLAPGAEVGALQTQMRGLAGDPGLLDFSSAAEIRAASLRIFDRSFAVTYWLQAVAIAIGLFGIAASFSSQVLARRKEFGLLAHLGLTRGQVLALVAAEGAVWTTVGAVLGLLLGLAVSVVLVKVVNPQSFHWTMDLLLPWGRLGSLCAAVMVAGTATAWVAGRSAAGRDATLAVKEDW
ncbi:MAG: transporter permease [Rhizobacter sp.]|nr:transporter permease [Rhizobacter sp.]